MHPMWSPFHRLVSVVILFGWLAPGVGALGIGMHLSSEHHGLHDLDGAEHQREIADLVRAAIHGHHHDFCTTPDHHHDARFDAQAPAFRPGLSVVAVLPSPLAFLAALAERSKPERSPRRGPPTPLFTANCSLLL